MKAELLAIFGNDLMVVNTARVSFGKQHTDFDAETDTKLIRYLAAQNHWSPFSHPKLQFRLELPIFVARQWEKHRVGVVRGYDLYDQNEVSRRYIDDKPHFWNPDAWRARPQGSLKQGSGEDLDVLAQYRAGQIYAAAMYHAESAYAALLKCGVAPEQARAVLPQATYTSWIETGSLYYWARVCQLRLDTHAQHEIAQLAAQVAAAAQQAFPVSWPELYHDTK